MYNLVYTNRAVKDIKKLAPDIKKRIGKTLLRYQQHPLDYSEALTDARLGTYRF
jgi:mRNA interferase RelE/StbE